MEDGPKQQPRTDSVFTMPEETVLRTLQTDTADGLSQAEADKRLAENGPNALTAHVTPKWVIFLRQFKNVIIYILLLAAVLTLIMRHWSDATVILLVVIINAFIGYYQEVSAANALDKIRNLLSKEATVIRDGKRQDIDAEQLVVGDIVYLEAGDNVPADLRIVDADNLRIQESMLTGEPDSVEKNFAPLADAKTPLAERQNMAYASTAVTNGSGTAVVTAVAEATEIGQISKSVGSVKEVKTPLMRELDGLGKWISYVIVGIAVALFIYGWIIHLYALPTLALAVVTMIVGSLPEGLPASTAVILSLGVGNLTKHQAIVKTLPAVETLGAVDIIATDKTGTLTKNEMTAQDVYTKTHHYTVTGTGYAPDGTILLDGQPADLSADPDLTQLLISGFEANDTFLNEENGQWTINGEPTDGAFLTLYRKQFDQEPENVELDRIPFDSDYRYIAKLVVDKTSGQHVIMIKGSPDKLFSMASSAGGFDAAEWQPIIDSLTQQGKRVVAVGVKPVSDQITEVDHDALTSGVTMLGVVGIIDPPREEVIDALKQMRRAGVKVKMITGDHPVTATAIGEKLGLSDNIKAITGPEIDALSFDELKAVITRYDVFARATPQNKLDIVRAYQANGLVTAMTGDGVNDAPALKQADIGVAMGIKGTDVAKDSADMVLADDNFSTMDFAIREGRRLYDNIKKSILFLLPTSFAEGLIVAISIMFQQALPLVPTQLLWINMVSAITIQFAFIAEPAEPGIMDRPPRQTGRSLMNKHDVFQMTYVSIIIAVMGLVAFDVLTGQGVSEMVASTVAVNIIVLGKVFYLFNIRTPLLAISKTLFENKLAFIVIGILMVLQLGLTYLPFMQTIFKTAPMTWQQWAISAACGLVVLVVAEVDKMIRIQLNRRRGGKPLNN
ncbi:HAD-IC family P-type ATPase [Secundilactobacillus kimchicus]|uniref:Cation transport ATPase n=1 Tax=Secundilactobacillus kimchicus JCM 15530 TaxID=1302272 RepID=A0A0R1HPN4_9LACO|nr:cation transport ATPase [Secundilactobacillus kimchicus JCM 15530]MBT9672002.1 HAD-IC family P-type ATPase [Secundilactobacillus kimchicus]